MPEDHADERAPARAEGAGSQVTLQVVLCLDDLPFLDAHIFATLAVGFPARLFERQDAHLHGDDAPIHLERAECQVEIDLPAKNSTLCSE